MLKIKTLENMKTKFHHKDGKVFIEFFLVDYLLNVRKVDITTNIEISRQVCGKSDLKFFLIKNNLITLN